MALQLTKLASQGRAFDSTRPFTSKEHEAVLDLIRNAGAVIEETINGKKVKRREGLQRTLAADYVRNGITTVSAYDKAVEAEFVPKSLEQIHANVVAEHAAEVAKELGIKPVDLSDDESESTPGPRNERGPDVVEDGEEEEVDDADAEEGDTDGDIEQQMPTREAMLVRAAELDVPVTARMRDETLWERIKKAEADK